MRKLHYFGLLSAFITTLFMFACQEKELDNIVKDIVANKLTDIELAYFIGACYAKDLASSETIALTKAIVKHGGAFKARIGAEAVRELLRETDLAALCKKLHKDLALLLTQRGWSPQ